jgi:hypothetical protein
MPETDSAGNGRVTFLTPKNLRQLAAQSRHQIRAAVEK